jgi:nucleoid-associated protein YgaU
MSLSRWTATALVLAGTAWALAVLGPGADQVRQVLTGPQQLVDTAGPDALLVPVAAAAGWLCWGWGVLGLSLTAASSLPGAGGRAADLALRVLLPAGARRLAAVAVGLSLGTGATGLIATPAGPPGLTLAAAADGPVGTAGPAPPGVTVGAGQAVDQPGAAPPDWPDARDDPPLAGLPAATDRVVLRGDCLWDIAAEWLAAQRSDPASVPADDVEVLAAVQAWWQANAAVIGPDPDLLLPGQVLTPPGG